MPNALALPPGRRLRYALQRNSSRGAQIGCTFGIALLLGALAYPALRYPSAHPDEDGKWLLYVVGGGFALFAILLAYSAVHQIFALRTAETHVEIDAAELPRGGAVPFFIQQRGPAEFESLRANLVGEEHWFETVASNRRERKVRQLGVFNVYDSGPFAVDGFQPFERMAVVKVPQDVPASGENGERTVTWQLEVWGKVNGRADFQHVYKVTII